MSAMAMDTVATFCAACEAASLPGSPGPVRSNQGIGRMFWGRAHPCGACGSEVRTLWSVFRTVPVVPRGSWRVIEFEERAGDGTSETPFLARRVPLCWPQVLKAWAVALVALLFLGWVATRRRA